MDPGSRSRCSLGRGDGRCGRERDVSFALWSRHGEPVYQSGIMLARGEGAPLFFAGWGSSLEIRFPMWLRVVDRPGAREFAILSEVEAFSRAVIAGVIPQIGRASCRERVWQ